MGPEIEDQAETVTRPRRLITFGVRAARWLLLVAIIIVVAIAMADTGTEEQPAGQAGALAAVVAFCTAGLALSKNSIPGEQVGRGWDIVIGIGTLIAGYLWFSAEIETLPLSWDQPLFFALLFALSAFIVLMTMAVIWIVKSDNK